MLDERRQERDRGKCEDSAAANAEAGKEVGDKDCGNNVGSELRGKKRRAWDRKRASENE